MVETKENQDHFYCHRCQQWHDMAMAVPTYRGQKLELICLSCARAELSPDGGPRYGS